jgi:Protein of unknown function (DUF2975)
METKKAPLSIRVIYWLTSIVFGLLATVFLGAIVFNILLYTDFFGNDMQLHILLPVKVDFLEIGNLRLNNQNIKIELVDATTRIHFFNTPGFIAKKFGIAMLCVSLFACYLTWTFRMFIKNVKDGEIFTLINIALLKRISYTLIGFWLFTVIYIRIAYYYIAKGLEFDNVFITDDIPDYSGILFIALFIWVLAHIFGTGLKLQQEKDLTI